MAVTSLQIPGFSKSAINVTLDFLCYSSSISFERIAQFHCNAQTLTGLTKSAATNSKQEKPSSKLKDILWHHHNQLVAVKKDLLCIEKVAVNFSSIYF